MNTNIEYEEIAISYAEFAAIAGFASTDETRLVLNSVCLELHGNFARLVATDGRRLGVLRVELREYARPSTVVVPLRLIKAAKIFSKSKGLTLCIEQVPPGEDELFSGVRLTFRDGRDSVTGWSIEDKYPAWQCVLPKGEPSLAPLLSFSLDLVATCLSAVKALSRDGGTGVYLRRYCTDEEDEENPGIYSLHLSGNPNFFGVLMPIAQQGDLGLPEWVEYAPVREQVAD